MTVYVDDFGVVVPWGKTRWCRLIADDLAELHAFAEKIGVKERSLAQTTQQLLLTSLLATCPSLQGSPEK